MEIKNSVWAEPYLGTGKRAFARGAILSKAEFWKNLRLGYFENKKYMYLKECR